MAWIYQNGVRGYFDDATKTFVPKDKLMELRANNPNAYSQAGNDAEISQQPADYDASKVGTQYNGVGLPAQGQVKKDDKTGALYVFNQNTGQWVPETDMPTSKGIEQYKSNQNPNAQMVGNLGVLAPTTWMDNPIAQYIPLSDESIAEQERLRKNAINPAGMDELNQSAKIQADLAKNYGQYTDPASMKRYEDALYEAVANRMRNEAGRVNEQTQADLAARGLGMSTVVNDITGATNRNLMQNLGDAASNATITAEQMRQKYLQDMATSGVNMSNVGTQKQNVFNAAATPYQNAIQYQDANKILNLGLQNQAWKDKVGNAQYLLNLPQAVTTGQNQIGATAAQVGTNIYNTQNANAAGQNTVAGQVGSQLAGAFKPKQTQFIPTTQVQGAGQGVITGANAGFKYAE